MRNRVSSIESRTAPNFPHMLQRQYTNTGNSTESHDVYITDDVRFNEWTSEMNDEVMGPPGEVYVDPKTGRWRRYRRHRAPTIHDPSWAVGSGGLMRSQLKPVLRCEHQKTTVRLLGDLTIATGSHDFPGNYYFDRYTTNTFGPMDGGQVIHTFAPQDINNTLSGAEIRYSAGAFLNHDWFALADSFDESCSQFIHSSTLIGESIIEHGIYRDAFKLVINPSSAIKTFIGLVSRFKRHRKMTLGQASKKLLKGSANANLFYQFGVKPAIDDIRDAILAHKRVSERLKILTSNAGRYIPIRVRNELYSSHENVLPSTDDALDFQWTMGHKKSIATLGGWGRVRSDLQFNDTWSAYLQYFGINKAAGLIWELIPFSFVVDWFTNTQEYINKYTRLRTGGPFEELCNIWSSTKQETLEELNFVPGRVPWMAGTDVITPQQAMPIVERLTTAYTRIPGIPETSGVVDFSSLGLFHAITSGSLILQGWR